MILNYYCISLKFCLKIFRRLVLFFSSHLTWLSKIWKCKEEEDIFHIVKEFIQFLEHSTEYHSFLCIVFWQEFLCFNWNLFVTFLAFLLCLSERFVLKGTKPLVLGGNFSEISELLEVNYYKYHNNNSNCFISWS